MTGNVIIEGLTVGVVVLIVSTIFRKFLKHMNITLKEYLIIICIGALTHLIFEVAGFNTWYCKHGTACKKK